MHGLEFLAGGGEGGFDRGDLSEPALFSSLLETVEEIGVDLLQAGLLSWVNAK